MERFALRAVWILLLLLGQTIQDHLITSGAVTQFCVDSGDGGAADRNLAADHFVGVSFSQQSRDLEPLGEGSHLLDRKQIAEKGVAFFSIFQ